MKKKKYFNMRVTNPAGQQLSLTLPRRYKRYFDTAIMDKSNTEYDNSLDAMIRFYQEYFCLDDDDRELFQDIICCGLVNPLSIVDLIILAQTLDEYAVIKGIKTPAELAEFYSYLAKKFESDSLTAKMPENMYDDIGREIVKSEKGRFFRGCYYLKMANKMKVR